MGAHFSTYTISIPKTRNTVKPPSWNHQNSFDYW